MAIRDALLPEFDAEMASTRRMLERVPESQLAFKPHPKSPTLEWLAWHVADIPSLVAETVNKSELDFAPPGAPKSAPPKVESREQLLAAFDKKVAEVLRSFVMNHLIHHRAQLGVYLRLLGFPVPGMYGPTADDKLS